MIKDKYIPHLAAIVMVLALTLVVIGSVFNMTSGDAEKQDITTIEQPEYMRKIFDKDQLLQINIQIDESKWEELKENAAAEAYYPADITINGETYRNVGIRAKGNSSLTMVANDDTTDRYSFKIKVNEYQEQNIYGLEKFVLNNMIGDATYMKEYLSYDMYKEMGIATPGYAFANITINGEPWGVYLAVEALEESFIERNFGDLNGNLYKVESMGGMGGGNGKEGGNSPEMPNGDKPQMPNDAEVKEGQENQVTDANIKAISTTTIQEQPPAKPNEETMQIPPEGMPQDGKIDQMPEGDIPQGGKLAGNMPPIGGQGEMSEVPPEQNGNMMPPSGEVPGDTNNAPPIGNEQSERPEIPQAGETSQVPEDTTVDNHAAASEGETQEDATDEAQVAEQGKKFGPSGDKGEMKSPGGMGSSGGANLVYSDDEISSYSSIFNYTILKKTTEKDYAKVIASIKSLNEGTNLEEYIDVEEVLKYFAINTFLVNLDSYAGNMKHNFYLYEEDGKLQVLPWDYNLAFGAFEMSQASKVINFPIDTPVTDSMENSPLIAKLLEVDKYKEMYHSYLQELIDIYITSGKYEETINKLDALIGEYVKEDATAFYTYDEYQTAIKELKQYGVDRTTSILAQLSGEQPSTEYGTVETNINLIAMGQQNGGGPGERDKQDERSNDPQGGGMFNMPSIDMETMRQVMGIIGETASIDELTQEQKEQIAALDIDGEALESLFNMKKNFNQMGPGMPGEHADTKMSTEDKIMAVVCSVLLVFGLIFALRFKRKRY